MPNRVCSRIFVSASRQAFTVIELLTVLGIVGLLMGLLLPAVLFIRTRAQHVQCVNRLRQIGLTQHAYVSAHGKFPTSSPKGEAFSGLSRLHALWEEDPAAFICPADREGGLILLDQWGRRSYLQNDGTRFRKSPPDGFRSDRLGGGISGPDTKPSDFVDGLSYTAAVSERLFADNGTEAQTMTEQQLRSDPVRFFWYTSQVYPDEVALASVCETDRTSPFPFPGTVLAVGGYGYDHVLPPNHVGCVNGPYDEFRVPYFTWLAPASSQHGGYVNVLLADGAVRSVTDGVDLEVWRALGTRAGQEPLHLE